jgi:hypothetical protein
MYWCLQYCMYVEKPNEETCLSCEKLDECYELNKVLTKVIEEGRALLRPMVR